MWLSPPLLPELGENLKDAAGSLNPVYHPFWMIIPSCNLFPFVYPRVVSMSMPNYCIKWCLLDKREKNGIYNII